MKTGMTIYWEINNVKRKIEILQMKIVDHTPGSEQHTIMENRLKSLRELLDSLIDVKYVFLEGNVNENMIYEDTDSLQKPSPLSKHIDYAKNYMNEKYGKSLIKPKFAE